MSSFKRWPKAFLALLAWGLLFETGTYWADDYLYVPPFEGLRMQVKNEFSQASGEAFDILVLGDCYNFQGVIPKILEKNTRLKIYNFSTSGDHTILATYLLLKNYLKSRPVKPRYVIISFQHITTSLTKEEIVRNNLPYLYDFKKGNIDVLTKEFGLENALKWLVPTLKHQYRFREFLRNPFSISFSTQNQIRDFKKEIASLRGYYAWRADRMYAGDKQDDGQYPKFKVTPFFDRYLRAILSLAAENQIGVLYIFPTTTPDWYKLDQKYGYSKNHKEYLKTLQKIYPDLKMLNPQSLLMRNDMYVDTTHLNPKGAGILSDYLSRKIDSLKLKKIESYDL